MSPELINAQRITVGVESKRYDHVNPISGDEALSRDIIQFVFNKTINETDDWDEKSKLSEIKAQSLNLKQCLLASDIIKKDSTILIVPNVVNHHLASNTIKVCWERSFNIESDEVMGLVSEEVIAAYREQGRLEIQLLTISEMGAVALKNMIAKFQRAALSPVRINYNPTISTPLIYTPPKKERNCFCTIQ